MSKFRGMTGCFRQAVVDAGLEKKIEVNYTTIYNDKQPANERRFNWERCVVKKLTKKEEERLAVLQKDLGESGFLDAYSDPYFSAFVKAWSRKHGNRLFDSHFLSDNDREQLSKMTDEILAELDEEEASE